MSQGQWPPKPGGWEEVEIPRRTMSARWPLPAVVWAVCPEHGEHMFILLYALNVYACAQGECNFGMDVDTIEEDGGLVSEHCDWPWKEHVYFRQILGNIVLDRVESGASSAAGMSASLGSSQ